MCSQWAPSLRGCGQEARGAPPTGSPFSCSPQQHLRAHQLLLASQPTFYLGAQELEADGNPVHSGRMLSIISHQKELTEPKGSPQDAELSSRAL